MLGWILTIGSIWAGGMVATYDLTQREGWEPIRIDWDSFGRLLFLSYAWPLIAFVILFHRD